MHRTPTDVVQHEADTNGSIGNGNLGIVRVHFAVLKLFLDETTVPRNVVYLLDDRGRGTERRKVREYRDICAAHECHWPELPAAMRII